MIGKGDEWYIDNIHSINLAKKCSHIFLFPEYLLSFLIICLFGLRAFHFVSHNFFYKVALGKKMLTIHYSSDSCEHGARVFQKLPRNMQRRAVSSNPRRLPRYLREKHMREVRHTLKMHNTSVLISVTLAL